MWHSAKCHSGWQQQNTQNNDHQNINTQKGNKNVKLGIRALRTTTIRITTLRMATKDVTPAE
jgi:hypothetical protein